MGGVVKHLLSRGNGITMRKQYWIGPPEHNKSSDQIEIWLESGDLVTYLKSPRYQIEGSDVFWLENEADNR